jgi:hypothetical protein
MIPAVEPSSSATSIANFDDFISKIREGLHVSGWLVGLAVILLVWQTILFAALLGATLALSVYAAVHILGCALISAFLMSRLKTGMPNERIPIALQMVAWCAFAGPYGALVATVLAASGALISSDDAEAGLHEMATSDAAHIESDERAHIALMDHRIRLEGASRIRPLMDVIAEGSRPEKLEALRVLYRKYEAGLCPALDRALRDSDTSVRVLAATVIAKLNARYSHDISDRQRDLALDPEAARRWRTLAAARIVYAESRLLEPQRARGQVEAAIGDLCRAIELDPGDSASRLDLDKARRSLATYES